MLDKTTQTTKINQSINKTNQLLQEYCHRKKCGKEKLDTV